jgi:hypothetical protein
MRFSDFEIGPRDCQNTQWIDWARRLSTTDWISPSFFCSLLRWCFERIPVNYSERLYCFQYGRSSADVFSKPDKYFKPHFGARQTAPKELQYSRLTSFRRRNFAEGLILIFSQKPIVFLGIVPLLSNSWLNPFMELNPRQSYFWSKFHFCDTHQFTSVSSLSASFLNRSKYQMQGFWS